MRRWYQSLPSLLPALLVVRQLMQEIASRGEHVFQETFGKCFLYGIPVKYEAAILFVHLMIEKDLRSLADVVNYFSEPGQKCRILARRIQVKSTGEHNGNSRTGDPIL